MKKHYYSMNINNLKVSNIEPLQFEHSVFKKDVCFYQSGILGRFIRADIKEPTNTLEEAQEWLIEQAQKNPNLEDLNKELVPYIDLETLKSINKEQAKEKMKTLKKQ